MSDCRPPPGVTELTSFQDFAGDEVGVYGAGMGQSDEIQLYSVNYPAYRANYPASRMNYPAHRVNYPAHRANYPAHRVNYPAHRVNYPAPRAHKS